MNRIAAKAGKALRLALSDSHGFWCHLKPYLLTPRSGKILLNGIAFEIDLDLDPCMKQMYFELYQVDITSFLKKHLRKGDTFIDVGANVGYVSAYAMGLVGQTGEVHAFEPVPQYFERLKNVQRKNPDYRLHINKVALGEHEGTLSIAITNQGNIGWNTMVPDFMSEDTIQEKIEIPVITLDCYLSSYDTEKLRLVKIDVEGFEFPVIKGFQKYLHEAAELPILVVEVAPTAYQKLDTSIDEFADLMNDLGYVAYTVNLKHEVKVSTLKETTDVVFMPKSAAQQGAALDRYPAALHSGR